MTKAQLVRELKSLRRKVADKDRLLAELIRNYKEVPIGLCVIDLNLRYVHINDWLAEINGVPVEEHLGRTVREVLPDVAEGVEPHFRHVIETGEPILGGTVEVETPARPGIKRTFRHNYYPVMSGDATVVGVSCVVEDITERKRAEAELRQSEANEALQRAQFALDHASDAAIWLDRDGHVVYANTATEMMLGYSRDELLSSSVTDYDPDASLDDFRRAFERIKVGGPSTFEARHRSKVGKDMPVEVSVHYMHFGDKEFMCSYSRDITERKRAEEALRESGERTRAVLDNVADCVVTMDEKGRIQSFNPAAERAFGYTEDEVMGRNVRMLMAEPDRTGHDGYIRSYLKTGKGKILGIGPREVTGRRKDGATLPLELAVSEMFVGGKRVFIGAMRDITERKRAEEALRESETRLVNAHRIARLGAWERDLASGEMHWSDECCRIFGVSPEDPEPRLDLFNRFVHPDDRALIEAADKRAIKGDGHSSVDFRVIRADGEVRYVHSDGEVTFDDGGKPLRMIGTNRDITERKQMEMELLQAQKMELVGQLTGGIAHDFNNLLAVILGNLELVEEELAGNEAVGELLQWAIGAADSAAALTQQLLAFSRKQPLRPRSTRVNELVGKLVNLSRRTLGETIAIKTALARDLWATYVDPGQLEAALLNLVVNARDAMPKGGGITIETRNRAAGEDGGVTGEEFDAGDHVMIAVSDTGSGMPPEVIERVFEPFFTTKDVGKGSGLGLSMVYGFVRQSGGRVIVQSEVGKGTTVRLYLPRADETEAPEPAAPGRPQIRGQGQTILVVEDDAEVRALAVRVIEGLGYRVCEAANAASALEILAERPEIELLFTDLVLPGGMGGTDLAREARRLRPELHVLYASGYTEDAIVRHGWLDDGVELIEKPYRKEMLAGRLAALLGADAAGTRARR
ncbi:MAG: PAS domain S-box protein [Proteobacteria bacterium]|nr:PAS domain S-box protein [Pseudomonadota bacterium]